MLVVLGVDICDTRDNMVFVMYECMNVVRPVLAPLVTNCTSGVMRVPSCFKIIWHRQITLDWAIEGIQQGGYKFVLACF